MGGLRRICLIGGVTTGHFDADAGGGAAGVVAALVGAGERHVVFNAGCEFRACRVMEQYSFASRCVGLLRLQFEILVLLTKYS